MLLLWPMHEHRQDVQNWESENMTNIVLFIYYVKTTIIKPRNERIGWAWSTKIIANALSIVILLIVALLMYSMWAHMRVIPIILSEVSLK